MGAGERSIHRKSREEQGKFTDSFTTQCLLAESRKDADGKQSHLTVAVESKVLLLEACMLTGMCRPTPECAAEPCNLGQTSLRFLGWDGE